jgi:hypothetical protein
MKNPNKVKQGKKNRASGKRFELIVRKDLESKGWIVFRNSNDVEEATSSNPLEWEGGMMFKQAKSKFNPFTHRPMMTQSGFPDFIVIKSEEEGWIVQFVECKVNGILDKKEKQKVEWIRKVVKISVVVASKIKEGRKIGVQYLAK